MVKKIVLLLFLALFISCSYNVNEFGKRRYVIRDLKPYSDKCVHADSIIFLTGYYKLIIPDVEDRKIVDSGLRKNFLVFYEGDKVGNFLDFDGDKFDFNPKKAEMGYYGKVGNRCLLKFKVNFPSGYKVVENEILFINKDSIIIYTKKSPTGGGFKSKYLKVYNKNLFSAKNPDW